MFLLNVWFGSIAAFGWIIGFSFLVMRICCDIFWPIGELMWVTTPTLSVGWTDWPTILALKGWGCPEPESEANSEACRRDWFALLWAYDFPCFCVLGHPTRNWGSLSSTDDLFIALLVAKVGSSLIYLSLKLGNNVVYLSLLSTLKFRSSLISISIFDLWWWLRVEVSM